jgi:hypothetical protein
MAVEQVDGVGGGDRDERVGVGGQLGADLLDDGGVVAGEVRPGLPGLAGDPRGDDHHIRAGGRGVVALPDDRVRIVGDPVVRVGGLSHRLLGLARDVDEDDLIDHVAECERVCSGRTDGARSPHNANFTHTT